MRDPFKTGSFAIIRKEVDHYDETAGLFHILVAFENKDTATKTLESLIQFFSEWGPFLFRDLLIGISYNENKGECFILKLRDQVFAHEVHAAISKILLPSLKKVYLKKVMLPKGSPLLFGPDDLLPFSPVGGPSWKLHAHGHLVEEIPSFSHAVEYIHFLAPQDMIPAVSLCHRDYNPGESPAIQVKIVIKGMTFSEQFRNTTLLFSYLLPNIDGQEGITVLKDFLHMKTDISRSNVELYLSFGPDSKIQEIKKEITYNLFRVLIKDLLSFCFDWAMYKPSTFAIEGDAPLECNMPQLYQRHMHQYFNGDRKKSAILKFRQEAIDIKCLVYIKATFKLDENVHMDRLFVTLYELLGRHDYARLNGLHITEIKVSPFGSKNEYSIQLTYANMSNNYGIIMELFTAILRSCGIEAVPFAKILKSLRPGAKEAALTIQCKLDKFTSKSIIFDAKETGRAASLLAAFKSMTAPEQEVFNNYFSDTISALVKAAEPKEIEEIKEEEKKPVRTLTKSKPTMSKKQARKLRAASSRHVVEEPKDEIVPEEPKIIVPEPVLVEQVVETSDEETDESEVEEVSTTATKKKIKASKRRRLEARERAKQQSVTETNRIKKEEVAEVSLQDLIENLVGDKTENVKEELAKVEASTDAFVPIETVTVETEVTTTAEETTVHEPEIFVPLTEDVKIEMPLPKTTTKKVLAKSYADALLNRTGSSEIDDSEDDEESPRSVSPILGPVLDTSVVLGPIVYPTHTFIPSEWYPTPLVLVTPNSADSTFAYPAGTWDMYRGGNLWWSPFWLRNMAVHVIRKILYTTPRPSTGPQLVSLVVAVPLQVCPRLVDNVLEWIETDPSAYIRHRTLSVSLIGGKFALLPHTSQMNYLVFTLRYPDDPNFDAWLDACSRIVNFSKPMICAVKKDTLFAPTQLSDMLANDRPKSDLPVTQGWTMIYNGKVAFESDSLNGMTNALKCIGVQRFAPFGVVHRSVPSGHLHQIDYNRTVSIVPTPGLPYYSVSALFNFFVRLLDTVQNDIEEPIENWMVPVLAHLESFYFTPVPSTTTYALNLQFDQFASPEVLAHASVLAANWSHSLCTLRHMSSLQGTKHDLKVLEKAANFHFGKYNSQYLSLKEFVSLLRTYVNYKPIAVLPEAMVLEFGGYKTNYQNTNNRWILSQVCLTDMPTSSIIHFFTELYYLPRWSQMIGSIRRIWIKRVAPSQFIVGFATEEFDGAMKNVKILTESLVVNSLLVAVSDLHVSDPLDTMEKLEASFAFTAARMTETAHRINEHIQNSIQPVEPVTEEKESVLEVAHVVEAPERQEGPETDAADVTEEPKTDTVAVVEEPKTDAVAVAEEIVPEPMEVQVDEHVEVAVEESSSSEEPIVVEEASTIEKEEDVNAIQAVIEEVPEKPVVVAEVPEEPLVVVEVWPKTLTTRINFRGVSLDCSYTLEEPLADPIPSSIESENLFHEVAQLVASLPASYFSSGKVLTISMPDSDLTDCIALQGSLPASDNALESALKVLEFAIFTSQAPVESIQIGPHGASKATFKLLLKPTANVANINRIKQSAGKSVRWSTCW